MAAASTTSRKRKRVVLSLENKICILDRLAEGERASKLATEFAIGNATVTDLKKNEANSIVRVVDGEYLSIFEAA